MPRVSCSAHGIPARYGTMPIMAMPNPRYRPRKPSIFTVSVHTCQNPGELDRAGTRGERGMRLQHEHGQRQGTSTRADPTQGCICQRGHTSVPTTGRPTLVVRGQSSAAEVQGGVVRPQHGNNTKHTLAQQLHHHTTNTACTALRWPRVNHTCCCRQPRISPGKLHRQQRTSTATYKQAGIRAGTACKSTQGDTGDSAHRLLQRTN